jgi:hypothetical protein
VKTSEERNKFLSPVWCIASFKAVSTASVPLFAKCVFVGLEQALSRQVFSPVRACGGSKNPYRTGESNSPPVLNRFYDFRVTMTR